MPRAITLAFCRRRLRYDKMPAAIISCRLRHCRQRYDYASERYNRHCHTLDAIAGLRLMLRHTSCRRHAARCRQRHVSAAVATPRCQRHTLRLLMVTRHTLI